MTHKCSTCGETKAITEFSPNKQRKVGVNPRCKACAAKRARTRYYQPGSREHDRELSRLRQEKKMGRPRPLTCEVCNSPATGNGDSLRVIQADHCHATGKWRGWLCSPCNLILGKAKDSPERLRALADYIESYK